jgi:uncharacterized protein YbjT (DUF2867 family)
MSFLRKSTVLALVTGLGCSLVVAAAPLPPRQVIGEAALQGLQGKTILLAGATGNNGSVVLQQLGDLGLKVRAMSRDVAAARERFGSRYEWVQADVTDPASLKNAVKGVDVVISAVATMMPVGSNRPERVDYEGTQNLARAAKAAGVKRFVIITSSVPGKRGGFLNLVGGNVLVWKGKAEEALVASGVPYVIVGPAAINDDPGGTRAVRVIPRSQYQSGMAVTRADLASVVIAAAGLPAAANRAFSVINGDGAPGVAWQESVEAMPRK